MISENQLRKIESYGYKLEFNPDTSSHAKYILIAPGGQRFATYENWSALDTGYQAGEIKVNDTGMVLVDNSNELIAGPGENWDACWDFHYSETQYGVITLFILACIVLAISVQFIAWAVDPIIHPCDPKEYIAGGKKIIVNPDCDRWSLDLATGKVEDLGGGTGDWIKFIVIGIVIIAGIWVISQSGIFEKFGKKDEIAEGKSGSSMRWGFWQPTP